MQPKLVPTSKMVTDSAMTTTEEGHILLHLSLSVPGTIPGT